MHSTMEAGPAMQSPRFFNPRFKKPGLDGASERPGFNPRFRDPAAIGIGMMAYDGKRMRNKSVLRKTVDYNAHCINQLENRIWQRDFRDHHLLQPDELYVHQLTPPPDYLHNPMNCVTTRFVRNSMNKIRCPIFCVCWTPEGRRLITGASSGEFTLWNGLTFNFETILQAHDTSVRCMVWSHSDQWMLTADHGGFVKYWQSNMNNVKMYQAHKEAIRGLSFCPTDTKYASCSDDGTVRIWDFIRCHEEKILRGHGADVKCVDWHPQKSLIASGSKDTQQPLKLWDPRTGTSLATIHAHKHTVMEVSWNRNGNWLLTASRDHLLKLFDIRNMKEEIQSFKGHKKEATTVAWHPIHESLFASGGSDGGILFWMVGNEKEVGSIDEAHETMVWSLAWHPLGHILVSGSNDHSTKFWTRNRPGDAMRDKYNLNTLPVGMAEDMLEFESGSLSSTRIPGMGLPNDEIKSTEEAKKDEPSIPGLDFEPTPSHEDKVQYRRKVPYAKPVPKDFEQAWSGNAQPPNFRSGASDQQLSGGSLNIPGLPPGIDLPTLAAALPQIASGFGFPLGISGLPALAGLSGLVPTGNMGFNQTGANQQQQQQQQQQHQQQQQQQGPKQSSQLDPQENQDPSKKGSSQSSGASQSSQQSQQTGSHQDIGTEQSGDNQPSGASQRLASNQHEHDDPGTQRPGNHEQKPPKQGLLGDSPMSGVKPPGHANSGPPPGQGPLRHGHPSRHPPGARNIGPPDHGFPVQPESRGRPGHHAPNDQLSHTMGRGGRGGPRYVDHRPRAPAYGYEDDFVGHHLPEESPHGNHGSLEYDILPEDDYDNGPVWTHNEENYVDEDFYAVGHHNAPNMHGDVPLMEHPKRNYDYSLEYGDDYSQPPAKYNRADYYGAEPYARGRVGRIAPRGGFRGSSRGWSMERGPRRAGWRGGRGR